MTLNILARMALLCLASALFAAPVAAQTPGDGGAIIALYPEGTVPSLGVPEIREQREDAGGLMIRNISEPTLELFRPAPGSANGTAIIIAPGGGFVGLGYDAGGTAVARRLAELGVTAFVLKYRTIESPTDPNVLPQVHMQEMEAIMARARSGEPLEVPRFAGEAHAVEDGARAVMILRQRASEWRIDPERIGVLGFSAGGFLAADLAIGEKRSRPDFVGLIYGGLRTPVPADASPAFIAGAADDPFTPNDPAELYTAWRQAGVAAELHLYERGGHGFDLNPKGATSDHWFEEFVWWLDSRGLIAEE